MIYTQCTGDRKQTLNVLLIGESRVDKSTWINAFANYCSFETLEEAITDGGLFPIPSVFTVTHPQTNQQITISSDGTLSTSTQMTQAGESVTQNPTEYVFWHAERGTSINLIDTPGLLDMRDAGKSTHDTDKQHVDNIFRQLSTYQEIHAIFILIKANVTRLSDAFQYTLTEIFKRLDKSACNNIIFIFTDAASSKFRPDETQPILQRFLKEKNLPIALPPEKQTIYCFEQSIMKYLAECKNKIPHDEDDDKFAKRNWQKSVQSSKELLCYLFLLQPHSLAVMMSINDATSAVSMISKLVLDAIMSIAKDTNDMEKKKSEAEGLKKEITRHQQQSANHELDTLLHITETDLVHEPLGHINVVCESARCSTVQEGHMLHPQVCCEACRVGGFIMYFCSSISWLGNCRVCGCKKSQHKWWTTKTTVLKKPFHRLHSEVIDPTADSDDELKQTNREIAVLENRVRKCKDETEQMIEMCAKLSDFTHQHALLAVSPTEDELLKCLENERQIYAWSTHTSREADCLADIQSQYEQHLSKAKNSPCSAKDVQELIKQLCKLPMKGHDIKKIVDD